MLKKTVVLILIVCLLGTLLCACGGKISGEKAYQIVLDSLGDQASKVTSYHIHEGTFGDKDCYNIYITVNGEDWTYFVSTSGELLGKLPGGHSH